MSIHSRYTCNYCIVHVHVYIDIYKLEVQWKTRMKCSHVLLLDML